MSPEYTETVMSKRARELYFEKIHPESMTGKEYRDGHIKFDQSAVDQFSPKGNLDIKVVSEVVNSASYQESVLFRFCVQLNLSSEQVQEIIKTKFKINYSDWPNRKGAMEIIERLYPKECETFGVKPDKSFPPDDFLDS